MVNNIKIKQIPLDQIKPYEKNPRLNDNAVPYVANSIREFGFNVPIVVDANFVIIGGHTRYKAAQHLGMETVPVIVADHLSEAQVKAFRLADNKVAEIAVWDDGLLNTELKELEDIFNFDMDPFGFSDIAEEEQPTGDDNDFDEEKALEDIENPITVHGDVWCLGRHRLICGDSCDESTIKRLLNGKQVDLYLTDPPYNVAYKGGTKIREEIKNDKMDPDSFASFLTDAFVAADSVLKPGGAFYIWHPTSEVMNFHSAICNIPGWMTKQYLLWLKNRFTFGKQDYQWRHEPCWYGWKEGAAHYFIDDRTKSTILEFPKPSANKLHPTMKPVELFQELILNSSREYENVLDSFGGSGTTIIACEQSNRVGFSCELDPKYADVIVKRWQNLTGKDAVLESTGDTFNALLAAKG